MGYPQEQAVLERTAGSPRRHERLREEALRPSHAEIQNQAALRASEARQTFLLQLSDALRWLGSPQEIQMTAARLLGEWLGAAGVLYADVETRGDGDYYIVRLDYHPPGLPGMVGEYHADEFGAALFAEMRAGRTLVVEDVRTERRLSEKERSAHECRGIGAFVVVPLIKDGQHVANFSVIETTVREWSAAEIALMEETAERTWNAVVRARAEEAVAADLRDTQLLRELGARMISEVDAQTLHDEVNAAARALCRADAGTVQIYDEEAGELVMASAVGFPDSRVRFDRLSAGSATPCGLALAAGVRTFVDFDDETLEDPKGDMLWHVEAGYCSAQSTPLISRSGKPIGMLSTHWRKRHRPTERELRFIDLLARQAADLIEQRQAAEALRRSRAQMAADLADTTHLHLVSSQLLQEDDPQAMYERLVETAMVLMKSDAGSMQMLDAGALTLLAWRGFHPDSAKFWEVVRMDSETSCGVAFVKQQRIIVTDVETCGFLGAEDMTHYRLCGWRAMQSTPLMSREGRLLGMISTHWREVHEPTERELRLLDVIARQAADLIDRRAAEVAIRAAKEAAELASQSKDRFLAVLSHELRTPLTPVLLLVGAMQEDKSLPAEVLENLAMIRRNIETETRLIDDLLDLTRLASGKVVLKKRSFHVNEMVQDACVICEPLATERQIQLEYRFDPEIGQINADPTRLKQAVWNVVKNAIKFTMSRGRVEVSTARVDGARCEIRVRDNGIGIPPEVLPHVFDAFEQGNPTITRMYGGLGLGLAITKALVDVHGGSIRADSAGAGEGACFTIELPVE